MRYGYDAAGNLTEVVNSSGEPLRFAYDEQGRVTKWTDRNGTWFSYVYDERGRVVRTEGVDGILSGTLTYDDSARTTTYTDSQGRVSTHRHNAEGLVEEETDPLGNVTRTRWDEYGCQPVTVTDPLGHTTRYRYDETGNLTELTLPDGSSARAAYNALGLPTELVEPGGAVWRHTYDERGNLLTTVDPVGAETRYNCDAEGRPTAITNALGHTRTMAYDAAGLPLALTDELGHTTTVRRDAFGRIVETTDPLDHTTRMGWTIEGRPSWRQHSDGTRESWTWDAEGNPLTHTNPAGHTTRHTVTHFGAPATRTDPDGAQYEFAYDSELRLASVTNPLGLAWSYTYDEAGHLATETDFNGRTLSYTHDAVGGLRARTNGAGETLSFTRDALGRVVEQRSDAGDVTTFGYSPDGSLCRAANSDAEVVLTRDAFGRVLTETVNGGTTTHVHDALGLCARRVTPSGLVSEWTYDPAGRPLTLRSRAGTLDFVYDAAGRETERHIGAEVTLKQSWSAVGLLTVQTLTATSASLVSGADRLLQHRTYAHQADGCVTEIRELTSGTRRFDLDGMGRVSGVRAHGWTERYAYDPAGNLVHATSPDQEAGGERLFDGTLVRSAGRTSYEYDAEGRLVRRTRKLLNGQTRVWSYAWNAEDRLTDLVAPDGSHWHYAYDPFGRRVSKHRVADDGSVADRTDFVWDDLYLAEQTTPDGWITTWDYAADDPRPVTQTNHRPTTSTGNTSFLAQLAEESAPEHSAQLYGVVTDAVGTPTELVAATGDLVWQRRTSLWGTRLPAPKEDASPVDCPLRFPGQYADPESGLHYNLHRYYDPETARYISADPLGLVPAPDHHAYVPNPPG